MPVKRETTILCTSEALPTGPGYPQEGCAPGASQNWTRSLVARPPWGVSQDHVHPLLLQDPR